MRIVMANMLRFAVAAVVLMAATSIGAPSYQVTILHPSTGFTNSHAYSVSGGQQVGYGTFSPGGQFHALLWSGTAGSCVDLNPAGFYWSEAYGVSGGQQVGYGMGTATGPGHYPHALLWSGTASGYVDLNPSGFFQSYA